MRKITIPSSLPTLRSDLLTLRPVLGEDAAALFEIYGDPAVMKYTEEEALRDESDISLVLESMHLKFVEGVSLEWAIVLNSTQTFIGTCSLHSFDEKAPNAEVGCLLKKDAWGQEYMKDALRVLTRYASEVLSLNRLIAQVAPENLRAQRLFKRLGYNHIDENNLVLTLTPAEWHKESVATKLLFR